MRDWVVVAGLLLIALMMAHTACAQIAGKPTAEAADANPFLPEGISDRGWPFVRGPDFDGHSPEVDIADRWPDSGPPVLWIRDLGQGYSAFVAGRDRVYTQVQSVAGQSVYCLDANTGETVWSYRYEAPYELVGVYPGPRATPTLHAGHVYFAAPSGLIGCLTADTGTLVWSRNVVDDFGGDGSIGFGYSCSPTVVDELVVLPVGGEGSSLVALNASNGTTVWAAGDDPASYNPALPIELNGRKLVVGYLQNSLVVHDRLSGEQLLRMDLSQGYDEHSAWPLYQEPYLWIAGPFRTGSQLLEIPTDPDRRTPIQVWKRTILSNDVTSSVLVDGHIYGFDIFDVQSKTHRPSRGKFRCIDLLTGDGRWSQGTGKPRRSNAQPAEPEIGQAGIVVADGKLILLNELGELILLRATSERCDELDRASVLGGELTWTPPILHRGRVYIRNHSRAVCVYVGEPNRLQSHSPVLSVADIPQTEYRDLATTILAVEPEYAFDIPSRQWLWRWYWVSSSILASAEALGWIVARIAKPSSRAKAQRAVGRGIAFLAGAAGTTVLSRYFSDFIFTWPVCLFAAFDMVAYRDLSTPPSSSGRVRPLVDRIPLATFLIVCTAYFLICRRLSLVFEWAFLAGFVGAIPIAGLAAFAARRISHAALLRVVLLPVSFTCFYGAGVALLIAKY